MSNLQVRAVVAVAAKEFDARFPNWWEYDYCIDHGTVAEPESRPFFRFQTDFIAKVCDWLGYNIEHATPPEEWIGSDRVELYVDLAIMADIETAIDYSFPGIAQTYRHDVDNLRIAMNKAWADEVERRRQ